MDVVLHTLASCVQTVFCIDAAHLLFQYNRGGASQA